MSYLLGYMGGVRVSQYERYSRMPTLQTALAYEAIFDVPVSELFAGISDRTEDPINERVQSLIQKIETAVPSLKNARKLEFLRGLASKATIEPQNQV